MLIQASFLRGLLPLVFLGGWGFVQTLDDSPAGGAAGAPAATAYRLVTPFLSREIAPPVDFEAPRVISLRLDTASITEASPVEPRDTETINGVEHFAQPSEPGLVAWYYRYGRPGSGGSNSLFSAHVNYFGFVGTTPFAQLGAASVGDDVYVGLDDGRTLRFTVASTRVFLESELAESMVAVVHPALPPERERVTLITCTGEFTALSPLGPGSYDSRLVVVAERIVD